MTAQGCMLALTLLLAAAPAPADDARAAFDAIEAARRAMDEEAYDVALEHYGRAHELRPDVAAIPYNMGIARYRRGELPEAAELFEAAARLAREPGLRARSAYNLGNAAYAQALRALQGEGDPEAATAGLEAAGEQLEQALAEYKTALAADPAREDARANAELTHRVLEELRRLQEEMEREGEQQQEQGEQEEQEEQQDGQEQQGEQDQQGEPQEQGEQQEQQEQGEQGEQAEQQEQQAEQQSEQQASEEPMSREQAERLLQRIRDNDERRRQERMERDRARRRSVEKDW